MFTPLFVRKTTVVFCILSLFFSNISAAFASEGQAVSSLDGSVGSSDPVPSTSLTEVDNGSVESSKSDKESMSEIHSGGAEASLDDVKDSKEGNSYRCSCSCLR